MDPILWVLLLSAAAAGAASLGAIPLVGRDDVPMAWIGWSNALAGGLMLGAAHTLLSGGGSRPLASAIGALFGVGVSYVSHFASGTEDLDLNQLGETDATYGSKVLLTSFLHSSAEGVAIGIAMVSDLRFGTFMALAIAVHNIPEATILCAVLRARGMSLIAAAALAVVINSGQVLLALVTFALVPSLPGAEPFVVGFAVAALIYLVLVELLPGAYRQAGSTTIAVVTSVTMGVLIFLRSTLS